MTDREPGGERGTTESNGERLSTGASGRRALVWRALRGAFLATGIAVLGVGLAAVFVPGTDELLPIEAAVAALGSDYVVVAVVGIAAVGLSALVVVARHVRGVREANPPLVEAVQSATYPGEALDRPAGSLFGLRGGGPAGEGSRERLEEAAVRATMRADGCSRSDAERRVAEGAWTDDPVAARCLSGSSDADGRAGSDGRAAIRSGRTLRRTVNAIVRLTDDGGGPGPEAIGVRERVRRSAAALVDALRRSLGGSEPVARADGGATDARGERHGSAGRVRSRRAPADGPESTARTTGRWRGIVAVVLLAVAVGVLAKRPAVLLVAAVGVAFAAYPLVTTDPEPELSVSRRVDPESAGDGDAVEVRTTVRNEGDGSLFDLRVVDGVPPMLSVSGGSPRCATTLRPGGEVTLEYELRARPGRHRFQPTTALCRDAAGAVEVETAVSADTTIECAAKVPTVPLRGRSRRRAGPLVTDEAGSGLEFHSVSEYERGDPASRIDWRRFARTGELTSVEFRAERLADVVVCVDARADAYRASAASEPHAVAHAVDAAGRIGDALLEANHRVGLAAFGRAGCLLPVGSGPDHADRFRRRLTTDPAFTLTPPRSARTDGGLPSTDSVARPTLGDGDSLDRQLSALREQVGSNTQVILLSPLCDDEAHRIVQRLESGGAAVTVVSPDVTTGRTAGGRLARLERDGRLTALRNAGVPAVDWDPETPLGPALAVVGRWNR